MLSHVIFLLRFNSWKAFASITLAGRCNGLLNAHMPDSSGYLLSLLRLPGALQLHNEKNICVWDRRSTFLHRFAFCFMHGVIINTRYSITSNQFMAIKINLLHMNHPLFYKAYFLSFHTGRALDLSVFSTIIMKWFM